MAGPEPQRLFCESLTPEVSGAGAPQGRRAPTAANKMPKAWPLLASTLNAQLGIALLDGVGFA